MVDHDEVTAGTEHASQFGDGVGANGRRKVPDVMAGDGGFEGALFRGDRETIAVDQARAAPESAASSLKQIWAEVHADPIFRDSGASRGGQQPPRAASDFQERARVEFAQLLDD